MIKAYFLKFENCVIGSSIFVYDENMVLVGSLETGLDHLDAIRISNQNKTYIINVRHKEYEPISIEWNPALDGFSIYVQQMRQIDSLMIGSVGTGFEITNNLDIFSVGAAHLDRMEKSFERVGAVGFVYDKDVDCTVRIFSDNNEELGWLKLEGGKIEKHHTIGNIVYTKWEPAEGGFGITFNGNVSNISYCIVEQAAIKWEFGYDAATCNSGSSTYITMSCVSSQEPQEITISIGEDIEDIEELTDEDFYKFQIGHFLHSTKDGRRGYVVDINDHPEFGVFYTLHMNDDISIDEVYHESDLCFITEIPKTEENKKEGFTLYQAAFFGLLVAYIAGTTWISIKYGDNIIEIINNILNVFQK